MARINSHKLVCLFVALWIMSCPTSSRPDHDHERKLYIVYMGNLGEKEGSSLSTLLSQHAKMIRQVVDRRFWHQSLIRSYTRSFNGFAAYLTAQEQEKMAGSEEVVSVFPSTTLHPLTTRSWDFLQFPKNIRRNPTVESDTIIGVIDTGIWPESESFNDAGFGPPPKKWRGVCDGGQNFTCNNKIIGARYYNLGSLSYNDSARDVEGHGSHCAAVASGNHVKDASFYGLASGTARGAVPSARIAVYKACYPDAGCNGADILAAFDDAIADGVDVITISIGAQYPIPLEKDSIALASIHAAQKGILVVNSCGNSGSKGSVSSVAPWIFSIAASNTDRGIVSKLVLGNGEILTGRAVNPFDLKGKSFPLTFGREVSNCSEKSAEHCDLDCIETSKAKGKIVLCNEYDGQEEAFKGHAVGSVVPSFDSSDVSYVVPFPTTGLNRQDFGSLESYRNSTKFPAVDILRSEIVTNLDAPRVASFSSRGPNLIYPSILKPDIAAPGVEILAAFSPIASPSNYQEDKRSVKYNVLSGTSMACPHVAGAAAYVKSLHPNWSSSAIKSALMTTARRIDSAHEPLAEFSFGAGNIDPLRASDPGLIYETFPEDYANFLCGSGYNSSTVSRIFGQNITCQDRGSKDLNYPSMTFQVQTQKTGEIMQFSANFTRTVTSVTATKATYKVVVSKSSSYTIVVNPEILAFEALNEKKSFEVSIIGKISNRELLSASLEWSDGAHNVTSPIVIYPDSL